MSSCRSGSLFWSSWAPLGVVFGRSGGRFGAFSAFQLIDSTHQLINSSIQPINSSTHRFNSSTHQLIDSTHQPINSSIQLINSSTLEFWNSIPKVDELSTTRPGGLRAARLNPPPATKWRENGVSDCRKELCPCHNCRRIWSYVLAFFHGLVITGPSKHKLRPEIEEEVSKHQNPIIIGVYSPPLFSPQELHAVRRATPRSAQSPSWKRSKM